MNQASTPALVPPPSSGNLSDHVEENANLYPSAPIISIRDGATWTDMSATEFRQAVRGIAKGLIAEGLSLIHI